MRGRPSARPRAQRLLEIVFVLGLGVPSVGLVPRVALSGPQASPVLLEPGEMRGEWVDAGWSDCREGSKAGRSPVRTGYYDIPLRRPADPRGPSFGLVRVFFAQGPFNVAVSAAGHYAQNLEVAAAGLPERPGVVHVAWVASLDLTDVQRIGVVGREGSLCSGMVQANKFIVFVTEERAAAVDQPTGRVVLRGASRSAGMESMFSHGFCPPDTPC